MAGLELNSLWFPSAEVPGLKVCTSPPSTPAHSRIDVHKHGGREIWEFGIVLTGAVDVEL